MATVQCKACGGIYRDVLPDGMRYFHTCPVLTPRALAAALVDGTVTLPPIDGQRLADARAADLRDPVKAGEPTRERLVLESLVVARPGARDENIDPVKAHAARAGAGGRIGELDPKTIQKAPGAGVTVLIPDDAA